MFNKKIYWMERQARKASHEAKHLINIMKIRAMLTGIFSPVHGYPTDNASNNDSKPSGGKHTRSIKERRMRRYRHACRIRAAA